MTMIYNSDKLRYNLLVGFGKRGQSSIVLNCIYSNDYTPLEVATPSQRRLYILTCHRGAMSILVTRLLSPSDGKENIHFTLEEFLTINKHRQVFDRSSIH